MGIVNAQNVLLSNGCSIENMINGIIKNLDEVRISPMSGISGVMIPDFTQANKIKLSDTTNFETKSNTFVIENDIVKNHDGYNLHNLVELNGIIQFSTQNDSGSQKELYMNFMPRYYSMEDYTTPTNWETHVIQQNFVIPTGYRRWVFTIYDIYSFGKNTTGLDFLFYPQSTIENLTFSRWNRCTFSLKAYSRQYQ